MHPLLLELGGFKIYSYSLMLVIAFTVSTIYAWLEARRLGEKPEPALDLAVLIFIFSFVGGRLLHCIVNWQIYLKDPVRILKIWEGGLVYYGGFLMVCLVTAVYLKRQRLSIPKWADIIAPCAMITLFFGRIGCFLNGCCYGSQAPQWLPFKVKYPISQMPLHLAGVSLYPTPIYESIATASIALFLIWRSRHKKFAGEIFWLMMLLYALIRFFLEYIRADSRGYIPAVHLFTSQLISLLIIPTSLFFLLKNHLRPGTQGVAQ